MTSDTLEALRLARFPRAATYDPRWVLDNVMGPNPLWLVESLSEVLPLSPEMRVLDLGCGKALTSIFLTKEFGLRVWAADLWIGPTENWGRVQAAGMEAGVTPLKLEAHALPFAGGFFDAVVSIDSYHYFGTDDYYLSYLLNFVRPGGYVGIVSAGTLVEIEDGPPDHLRPYWDPDFYAFHTPAWWRRHWARTGQVDVEVSDSVDDGWQLWRQWSEACVLTKSATTPEGLEWAAREIEMLTADEGRTLGFTRVVARKL